VMGLEEVVAGEVGEAEVHAFTFWKMAGS